MSITILHGLTVIISSLKSVSGIFREAFPETGALAFKYQRVPFSSIR
jgi:hypothetical protein